MRAVDHRMLQRHGRTGSGEGGGRGMSMASRVVGIAAVVITLGFCACAHAQESSLTTKEEFQKFYTDYLTGEGYRPEVDSDGDVSFKKEGLTYYVIVTETDAEFFELALPNIHHIEDEDGRVAALAAADYSNAKSKVSKVYLVNDDVWVTVELFIASPDDYKDVFERSMAALLNGANNFIEKMSE
jgi:hypothetical protein